MCSVISVQFNPGLRFAATLPPNNASQGPFFQRRMAKEPFPWVSTAHYLARQQHTAYSAAALKAAQRAWPVGENTVHAARWSPSTPEKPLGPLAAEFPRAEVLLDGRRAKARAKGSRGQQRDKGANDRRK